MIIVIENSKIEFFRFEFIYVYHIYTINIVYERAFDFNVVWTIGNALWVLKRHIRLKRWNHVFSYICECECETLRPLFRLRKCIIIKRLLFSCDNSFFFFFYEAMPFFVVSYGEHIVFYFFFFYFFFFFLLDHSSMWSLFIFFFCFMFYMWRSNRIEHVFFFSIKF